MSTVRERPILFRVEKEGRLLFKKYHTVINVYDDGISINKGDELFIPLKSMNPFINDNIIGEYKEKNRIIQIPHLDSDGTYQESHLYESNYPGICAKMEQVLLKEWAGLRTRYPETVRWFIGCSAIYEISANNNPFVYGFPFDEKFYENAARENHELWTVSFQEALAKYWDIFDRDSLLKTFDWLYDGRSVTQFNEKYERLDKSRMIKWEIKLADDIHARGEKSIWAWDLQRMILLCSTGYVCGYLGYEESLDIALKAAEKLQGIYDSWDDFAESYLLGFGYWKNQHPEQTYTEAHERKVRYEAMKQHELNPWTIPWKHSLKKEW